MTDSGTCMLNSIIKKNDIWLGPETGTIVLSDRRGRKNVEVSIVRNELILHDSTRPPSDGISCSPKLR